MQTLAIQLALNGAAVLLVSLLAGLLLCARAAWRSWRGGSLELSACGAALLLAGVLTGVARVHHRQHTIPAAAANETVGGLAVGGAVRPFAVDHRVALRKHLGHDRLPLPPARAGLSRIRVGRSGHRRPVTTTTYKT